MVLLFKFVIIQIWLVYIYEVNIEKKIYLKACKMDKTKSHLKGKYYYNYNWYLIIIHIKVQIFN
jgi:hypothetical protein